MKVRTQIRTIAASAALTPGRELSPEHLALVIGGRRSTVTLTESSYGDNDPDTP